MIQSAVMVNFVPPSLHFPTQPQISIDHTVHYVFDLLYGNFEVFLNISFNKTYTMAHIIDHVQNWAEDNRHTLDPINAKLKTVGKPNALPWSPSFYSQDFNGQKKKYEITGILAEGRGEVAPHPCNNCQMRYYPFTDCKVVPGHLKGSCANCFYKKKAKECSHHAPRK